MFSVKIDCYGSKAVMYSRIIILNQVHMYFVYGQRYPFSSKRRLFRRKTANINTVQSCNIVCTVHRVTVGLVYMHVNLFLQSELCRAVQGVLG
jgi:hypothetical protein